jgi:hypothetical protein
MALNHLFDASVAVTHWIGRVRPAFLTATQFWYVCLAPLLLGAVITAIPGRTAKTTRSTARQTGFLVLVFIILGVMRLPFYCRDWLNPDEASFISSAMRLTVDPIAYRSVDTGTSGPLNAYILTIPALFGGELSYLTARLMGTALMFGTIVAMWLTYCLLVGRRLASLLVMPFFICIASFSTPDFTHFSSEQLPVFFSAAILCLLSFESTRDRGSSLWPLAAVGVLAPAMVFAKLQSSPIAFVLLVAALCLASGRSSKRAAFLGLVLGVAALPVFLLTLFYRAGALQEFWYSFVGRNLSYSNLTHLSAVQKSILALQVLFYNPDLTWYLGGLLAMASVVLVDRLRKLVWPRSGVSARWIGGLTAASGLAMLLSAERPEVLVVFAGVCFCSVVTLAAMTFVTRSRDMSRSRSAIHDPRARPTAGAVAAFASILLATTVFAVGTPGTGYLHYGFLYLVPLGLCTVSAVLWFGESSDHHRRWRIRSGFTVCFLTLTCAIPYLQKVREVHPTAMDSCLFNPQSSPLVAAIRQHASKVDRLVVWGWDSQLHVATSIVPGTRFPDSVVQLEPSPHIDYFRKVYVQDFIRSMPAVFVDAVGPANFRYTNRRKKGVETLPELRQVIEERYRLLTEINGSRVFVRRD